jgi:aspartyl-tRNA(Asn)/glutamyl-tRNA(Gln) amidotransferase subunit A
MATCPPASIRTAGEQLRAGRTSSLALVDACVAAIDRHEERVRAWVLVDGTKAREQALRLDAELRAGEPRGPLHGIPIGIKDIFDVAGWPTLAGSRLRAGHVAARDSTVVERLRAAGAVIVGKTVTTEFACFDPPPTRNPWNLDRTPGGSSSGSCAAVALGMCLAALGSQTGGSITRPAAYCGIAGCKPTHGRVSTAGVVPISFHLDHPGPLAARVGDLAIVLSCIAGFDSSDPMCALAPVADFAAEQPRAAPPRLGVLGGFFVEAASTDVLATTATALAALGAAGASIEEVPPPTSFADVIANHRRIMAVEAAAFHRDNFPQRRADYGRCVAQLLDEGLASTALDYAEALAHRRRFARDLSALLAHYDALVTPAATTAAPGPETTGDPRFNAPFSYAGVPTVSLPCGLAADGLPVGLQLIGPAWSEDALLATAEWCEREIDFDARPALLAEGRQVE